MLTRRAGRGYGPPATIQAVLATLTAAVTACAGTPHGDAAPRLRFPDTEWPASPAADYRLAAKSAAHAYVKIVVVADSSRQRDRRNDSTPRTVNGASGIIVHPAGYVVTAAHIAGSTDLSARVTTVGGRELPAQVVHVDAGREMALLKIADSGTRFPAAEPGSVTRAGQPVFAIGTPDNRPGAVTIGRVTQPRLERRVRYGEFDLQGTLELAMTVAPGHSGGPVFDAEGTLVGMIVAFDLKRTESGRMATTGTAYAIPTPEIMAFFRQWAARSGNI